MQSLRLVSAIFSLVACGWWTVAAHALAPTDSASAQPVRLNTLGYLPKAVKRASVAQPATSFSVVRVEDNKRVLEGPVTGPVANQDTGEQLYLADFSLLTEPGEYRLEVADVGQSAPFRIAADLYTQPYWLVTRGMYLLRCGTSVRGEHLGHIFEHAACHLNDGHLDFVDGEEVLAADRHRTATGGWHDAGDYNKYVNNAAVTVGCMLRAWQDFQPQIEPIELDLPESVGPLPDLLAEVKWELDWLLTMQADDGSVYHKLSAAKYCGYLVPEAEQDARFYGEWGSQATASFIAVMAAAAREFRPYDPTYADRCLAAAKLSYTFLRDHPEYRRPGQEGFTTVGYDSHDWSARLWAAAEMWEATGDAAALADFEARAKSPRPSWRTRWRDHNDSDPSRQGRLQGEFEANWDWGNVQNLGLITYLESERPGRDSVLLEQIRDSLLATADQIVATRNRHGYARPLGELYFWGCNGTVARQVVLLEAASRIDAKPEYREVALDAVNHLFGRNVHGRSYVTGLGNNPPLHPHDRRSAADKVVPPWPGYLVGGPHPRPVDWHDVQDDYRTNEIAINWNGALIYALAACLHEQADEASDQP